MPHNPVHRNNIARYALAGQFQCMFGKSLSNYYNNLTGFDLLLFEQHFYPESQTSNRSLGQFVIKDKGHKAVKLILKLIHAGPLSKEEIAGASSWLGEDYVNTYAYKEAL